MLDKTIVPLLEKTSEILNLDENVIEKDYYVTQAIHALSIMENDYFRLVFAGGTCLAKAHKMVKRMSEDIDFKIQVKNKNAFLSKSKMLTELKKFRLKIMLTLNIPDLMVHNTAVRNEGKYSRMLLSYPSLFPVNDALRPHILLEFTLSDVHLETISLSVHSIMEDVLKIELLSSSKINCVSVDETAVEKWVGLTRRISAIDRKYHDDDPTLVRHIYDLNAIKQTHQLNMTFFNLAKRVIFNDARQFKNQYPEYLEDPCSEIQRSLEILRHNEIWRERYQNFIDAMVYDKCTMVEYDHALQALNSMSEQVLDTFEVAV